MKPRSYSWLLVPHPDRLVIAGFLGFGGAALLKGGLPGRPRPPSLRRRAVADPDRRREWPGRRAAERIGPAPSGGPSCRLFTTRSLSSGHRDDAHSSGKSIDYQRGAELHADGVAGQRERRPAHLDRGRVQGRSLGEVRRPARSTSSLDHDLPGRPEQRGRVPEDRSTEDHRVHGRWRRPREVHAQGRRSVAGHRLQGPDPREQGLPDHDHRHLPGELDGSSQARSPRSGSSASTARSRPTDPWLTSPSRSSPMP